MVATRRLVLGAATAVVGATVALVTGKALAHKARTRPDDTAAEDFDALADLDVEHLEVVGRDGAALHLLAKGHGRPVLLLHGIMLRAGVWRYQFALADRYRVIALDLRGHGRSTTGSAGYGLDRLADDIAEVLTMLDLRDAIVVGHSMGGMALLRFARRHRSLLDERVAGLVLVATTADPVLGFGSSTAFRGLAGALRIPGERIGWGRVPAYRPGDDDFNFGIVRLSFGANAAPHHVEATREMLAAMDREAFHRSFLGLLDNDELDHLAAIDLPATVVVGSRDLLTPTRVARRLAGAIPNAELVIVDGAGHQLMLERPAELAAVIDALAARIEAGRSAIDRGALRR